MKNMNNSFPLHINKNLCVGCSGCVDACMYHAITMEDFPIIDAAACTLCGNCVRACSAGALEIIPQKNGVSDNKTDDSKGIWVLSEIEDGRIAPVTLELLGKAHDLSTKLHQRVEAILIGCNVSSLTRSLFEYGAETVHLIDNKAFSEYVVENEARAIADLCRKNRPFILLVGATPKGRGLSARVASILRTGLTADCTQLEIDSQSGLLLQKRPAFGGNMMAAIMTPDHRPQIASVRPGVMKAAILNPSGQGQTIKHDFLISYIDRRIEVLEQMARQEKSESLENSKVVVGIGRGIRNKELVGKIQAWAEKIGAVMAGSRAAVEAGLIDAHLQVGQTGHSIAPDLYIAIGISGQIQHVAGITGAKKIIAINPDRNAPIYRIADYGFPVDAETIFE